MMATSQGTALVTGAAGFVGSHLTDYLLATGWRVHGVDDFSSGTRAHLTLADKCEGFRLFEGSVLDEDLMRSAMKGATHIFHLAARVGAEYVEAYPDETALHSVNTTRVVLRVAEGTGMPLFFASTSEIYGDSESQPLSESADIIVPPPANPRSCYALGKGLSELLVGSYIREGRGPAVIGRLFNAVGPRQSGRYGHVLPRFIERASAGKPLVVHGDGGQTRSFTAVADTVRAISGVLSSPSAHGQTINIGSSQEVSVLDLAELVLRLTGSASEIRHETYGSGRAPGARDIRRRVPDTRLLLGTTGFVCQTPLETAIRAVLEATDRDHNSTGP